MTIPLASRFTEILHLAVAFQTETETPISAGADSHQLAQDAVIGRIWNRSVDTLQSEINFKRNPENTINLHKNPQAVFRIARKRRANHQEINSGFNYLNKLNSSYVFNNPIKSIGIFLHGVLHTCIAKPLSSYVLSPIYRFGLRHFITEKGLKNELIQTQLFDEDMRSTLMIGKLRSQFSKIKKSGDLQLSVEEKDEVLKILSILKNYRITNHLGDSWELQNISEQARQFFGAGKSGNLSNKKFV